MSKRAPWTSFAALLASFVAFYPYLLEPVVNPRLVLIGATIFITTTSLVGTQVAARRMLFILVATTACAFTIVIATDLSVRYGDPALSTNVQRLFLVTPLGLLLGWTCYNRTSGVALARAFLLVATFTSLLAIVERLNGRSLFGRESLFTYLARDGVYRAILASDQSLVLGSMLAVAVPFTLMIKGWTRVPTVALLLLGVYATDSRGPLLVAMLAAAAVIVQRLGIALQNSTRLLMLAASVSVVIVFVLSTSFWTTDIVGITGDDYSANYRVALYATLPALLVVVPLGYGLGTFPQGIWLVRSEAFGVRDLMQTLDSELAYSAATFGLLGIAAVLGALYLSIKSVQNSLMVGLAALSVSILGFSLALHAWDGLGLLWLVLIGASAASSRRSRRTSQAGAEPQSITESGSYLWGTQK